MAVGGFFLFALKSAAEELKKNGQFIMTNLASRRALLIAQGYRRGFFVLSNGSRIKIQSFIMGVST